MAQERIDDWWGYAKEQARAERELQIDHWVHISIEYKDEAGNTVRLHSYDLHRELHERYHGIGTRNTLCCGKPYQKINTIIHVIVILAIKKDFNPI